MSVPASTFSMSVAAPDEMAVGAAASEMSAGADSRGFAVEPALGMSAPLADTGMTTTAPEAMMVVEARPAATSAPDLARVMLVGANE